MPCTRPVPAYAGPDGKPVLKRRDTVDPAASADIKLPCGRCPACKKRTTQEWALRLVHELSLHPTACFITLTYDEEHLPKGYDLVLRDWQLFAKRLRKAKGPFRYYTCGEYGEKFSRPHWHSILFSCDFEDKRRGEGRWVSQELEEIWGNGRTEGGDVTYASCAYVAGYVRKKLNAAEGTYDLVSQSSGEVIAERRPPFTVMSRGNPRGKWKRGIGYGWYERWYNDLRHGYVVHDGRQYATPGYYSRLEAERDPEAYAEAKEKRKAYARESRWSALDWQELEEQEELQLREPGNRRPYD